MQWAKEAKKIEVVEVLRATAVSGGPVGNESTDIEVRHLFLLKGAPEHSTKDLYVPDLSWWVYGYEFNPALLLLQPGRRLIVFQHPEDDGQVILDPCQAIAATPTALEELHRSLSPNALEVRSIALRRSRSAK